MRSPRSLVYLPVRSNRPPADEPWREGPLDVVLVHASMQFRVSAWKEIRARLGIGAAHTVKLHGVDKKFQRLADTDFEREGAWLRHFIEKLPAADREAAGVGPHQCVEIWPSK
jgi:hypothetical protein